MSDPVALLPLYTPTAAAGHHYAMADGSIVCSDCVAAEPVAAEGVGCVPVTVLWAEGAVCEVCEQTIEVAHSRPSS